MDLRVVIMAGGIGTRFWPLSRLNSPKQFLAIVGDKTMLEETVDRLLPLVPSTQIYTIADKEKTEAIKFILPNHPEENLLLEPKGKNTAPSLILATAWIYNQNPNAIIAALPADHVINDSSLFIQKLEAGVHVAATDEYLVTFGIPPTYPATGYGYIQFSRENPLRIQEEPFYAVQKFKEKPDYEQAKDFLEKGNYFWNSGMFIWQANVFAKKLEEYAPSLFPFWRRIVESILNLDNSQIASIFDEIPSISIDYALMEQAMGVLMCEGNFGWSDVGAWSALEDIWAKDREGNALKGEGIIIDSQNCLLYNPKKLTALIGVKDIIVVDTEDALLVCHKSQDQKVRDVVEKLKKRDDKDHL